MKKLLVLVLLALTLAGCEGGAAHDARVAREKQAKVEACSASGGYSALDPHYAEAVYCSRTPWPPR